MSAATYESAAGVEEESIFRTSSHALSDAAVDARASAKIAAQNVKDGVGWGVYKASFGVSFGVVFSAVFLTELLPGQSSLRRGLEDGAGAALDAIDARKLASHDHHLADDRVHPAAPPPASPVQASATPRAATRAPRKRTRVA